MPLYHLVIYLIYLSSTKLGLSFTHFSFLQSLEHFTNLFLLLQDSLSLLHITRDHDNIPSFPVPPTSIFIPIRLKALNSPSSAFQFLLQPLFVVQFYFFSTAPPISSSGILIERFRKIVIH